MPLNKFVAFLLLGSLLSGCQRAAQSDSNVIKIGEYASLTGTEATFGQSSHDGTILAVDKLNARGGVLGKKLELITLDNESKAGESATIVRKLISRDRVIAVLGEVASGRSLEASPICQENKIPMISPSSTNPDVTKTGDYIFRVCFIDSFQGAVLARFALRTLKARRLALLIDVRSPYSVGLTEYFTKSYTAAGGQIIAEEKYSGGDKDFNAQLTAIKAANPDAIFIPGYYTEAGLIALQARRLGITAPLFGGDGWESSKLIEIGGAAVEGTFYSTHYSPENPSPLVQEFVREFKARFHDVPDAMAALGYDSALILADAIRRAGGTGEPRLRDAIAHTKNFQGVSGLTTIDANRNARKAAVIVTVRNGQFKYVETITPDDVSKMADGAPAARHAS